MCVFGHPDDLMAVFPSFCHNLPTFEGATWGNQADFHQLLAQVLSVTMAYNGHINSRQAGANTRVICGYGSKLDHHPSSKTWDP